MNNVKPTAIRWRILALLFGLSFVAYVLRLNLSVAAVFVIPELGITEIQMGWIFGAFVWGYALFQIPGGVWGERIGPRRALAVIAVAWAAVTVLTAALPGILVATGAASMVCLLLLRFATGVVQAPFFPVLAGSVERWFPPGRWALPNALSSTGLGLGAAVTPPLISWLMLQIGWRQAFFVTAPIGLVAAWVWWSYARNDPATHPAINDAEVQLIRNGRDEMPADDPTAWRALLRDRQSVLITLSYLCMNYVFYLFFNWFYLYLVDVRGFGILSGGFVAALPWLVGALMASVGGEVCDRLCARLGPRLGCRLPGAISLFLVAIFLLAGAVAESAPWAIFFLTLCFSFTQATEGAYWSGMTFVAGRHTSAACGLLNMGGNLGGAISSPLIPIFVSWFGWIGALATGSLFAVIAAVLWLVIRVDDGGERKAGVTAPQPAG